MFLTTDLFDLWVKKLKRRSENRGRFSSSVSNTAARQIGKRYPHLDVPIGNEDPATWKDSFLAVKAVSQRAFYPFLQTIKRNKRFHKNEEGVRCRHPDGPKERPICCAAHRDALVYSWYSFILEMLLEQRLTGGPLHECVLAYRTQGRNNLHFAKEVFDLISLQKQCAVLAFDVKGFFDNLNHKILKKAWSDLLGIPELPTDHYTVYKSMTQFRVLDACAVEEELGEDFAKRFIRQRITYPKIFREKLLKFQITNREKFGIPQGAPLSAVLSNLYMYSLDVKLQEFATSQNGIYRRYSDDLLLVVPCESVEQVSEFVKTSLEEIELALNAKKTEIRFFTQSGSGSICKNAAGNPAVVQYLGLEFDGKNIRIRSASLARFHHRLRRNVRNTVSHALYNGDLTGGKVFKRKLYKNFSHLGNRNFVSYAKRARIITDSQAIRKQMGDTVMLVNQQVKREIERHSASGFLANKVRAKSYKQKPSAK